MKCNVLVHYWNSSKYFVLTVWLLEPFSCCFVPGDLVKLAMHWTFSYRHLLLWNISFPHHEWKGVKSHETVKPLTFIRNVYITCHVKISNRCIKKFYNYKQTCFLFWTSKWIVAFCESFMVQSIRKCNLGEFFKDLKECVVVKSDGSWMCVNLGQEKWKMVWMHLQKVMIQMKFHMKLANQVKKSWKL